MTRVSRAHHLSTRFTGIALTCRLTRRLQRTLTAVSSYNGLRSESLRGAPGACGQAPLSRSTLGDRSDDSVGPPISPESAVRQLARYRHAHRATAACGHCILFLVRVLLRRASCNPTRRQPSLPQYVDGVRMRHDQRISSLAPDRVRKPQQLPSEGREPQCDRYAPELCGLCRPLAARGCNDLHGQPRCLRLANGRLHRPPHASPNLVRLPSSGSWNWPTGRPLPSSHMAAFHQRGCGCRVQKNSPRLILLCRISPGPSPSPAGAPGISPAA